jgi:hypothetical protein
MGRERNGFDGDDRRDDHSDDRDPVRPAIPAALVSAMFGMKRKSGDAGRLRPQAANAALPRRADQDEAKARRARDDRALTDAALAICLLDFFV